MSKNTERPINLGRWVYTCLFAALSAGTLICGIIGEVPSSTRMWLFVAAVGSAFFCVAAFRTGRSS